MSRGRQSPLLPVLIPVGALVVIVGVLFGFSRVLLRLTSTAATATALTAAIGVIAVAAVVSSRKEVGGAAMVSLLGGFLGVAMLAGGVALLVGRPGEETEGPAGAVVAITAPAGAAASGFAQKELEAPADEAFTIAFDNQDPQTPHNVWIATANPIEEPGAKTLFEGTTITGPAKTDYAVDPLAAGEYFFYCQIHPATMTGTLTAVAGGGGAEPSPAEAA